MAKTSRPLGVTIIGWLGVISGILTTLGGLLVITIGAVFAGILSAIPFVGILGGAIIGILGFAALIWGIITILIYLWLLKMKRIAMWIVIVFSVIGLLGAIGSLFAGGLGSLIVLPGLIWNAIVVWYLGINQKKFH